MNLISKKEPSINLFGDILIFYFSLWITLVLRYLELPNQQRWQDHFLPFSALFALWLFVFFVAGLYEKQAPLSRRRVVGQILRVQGFNSVVAVLFFYFVPFTQIAPKTNLFIYLIVSVVLLLLWRVYAPALFRGRKATICLIARGEDVYALKKELTHGPYPVHLAHFIDLSTDQILSEDLITHVQTHDVEYVILDTKDPAILPALPALYNLMFSKINFLEVGDVYESIFRRVPISLVKHGWFLEHVKSKPHFMYDFFKRIMDVCIAGILLVCSLIVYPFVWLAIKIEDKGPLLHRDIRVGQDNKIITIFKFRSMTVGVVPETGFKKETKVGRFLRKTRIDELPQLVNVLKGDLSMIGPRPEQPKIVDQYIDSVPYYNIRHLLKPGLSGWAQIYHDNHPHHVVDTLATQEKLSYDLFYVKHRSIVLDAIIALKTLKTLILYKGK